MNIIAREKLIIKDRLSKDEEPLYAVKNFVVKNGVNKYDPITFVLPKTKENEYAYPIVDNENFILWDNHEYRIKEMYETIKGETPIKFITNARHRFYDLLDTNRDTTLTTGAKTINQLLSFIFTGTRWNFSVIDSFGTLEFENFGNDNCLSLFNKVIERFEAEFVIIGKEVRITKPQGSYVDMQFRYNHNIKTFKRNIDTSNLSTRIKGTGKLNEDGTPIVSDIYISPNAHLYTDDDGNIEYKDAPPYSNETIIHKDTLRKHLQTAIQDVPDVYFELEFTVLQDAGYTKPIPERGDVIPTILEQINVDVDLRIMEIEQYPFNKNRSPKVTLANYKKTYTNQLIDYQKSLLDKIWDENSGKLRYNVYDEAVQRATEALNNSLTELEYPPGMGIIARDPENENRFVAFRSSGIGITSDGGLTFDEAITHLGVTTSLLTAGQIYTNNIQIIGNNDLFYWDGNYLIAIDANDPNKYVKLNSDGLYIAKGAITIEGKDGRKFMLDGLANLNYSVFRHSPDFKNQFVEIDGVFYRTRETTRQSFDQYALRHEGRYLKVHLAYFVSNNAEGIQGNVYVVGTESGEPILLTKTITNTGSNSDNAVYGEVLTIDLGVPTYNRRAFYLQLRTTSASIFAYARVREIWQEG
ncbi:phage tail protein [Oceanobacillus arenosus]|uniref:phage tail protein n=1 Tax=Oceanobacillus arenosus TaxID=1229153 RepID=UPI001474D580|nr:phage tail protein [Oceanobacillus arenosus]